MTIMLHAIVYHFILGAVQGLTEFLPVSSSAHLVFAHHFFGVTEPQLLHDVILHLGTLAAVVLFLWRDILRLISGAWRGVVAMLSGKSPFAGNDDFAFAVLLVAATVPTALMGVLLKDRIESLFGSVQLVACALLVTGALLFATKYVRVSAVKKISFADALLIGIAQGCAICPGISRSGSTISAGIFRRLDPFTAARFSFLLSIPAILGAAAVEAKKLSGVPSGDLPYFALGFVAACLFGYISLAFLTRMVKQFRLYYFSFYCWAVGAAVLAISFIRAH
ncbi:MAG TPA: undecaprenyl-diphosphate phosphatase [bacterium]|nr:undecaprenyl-diphosphate phosphatase [bacterium]